MTIRKTKSSLRRFPNSKRVSLSTPATRQITLAQAFRRHSRPKFQVQSQRLPALLSIHRPPSTQCWQFAVHWSVLQSCRRDITLIICRVIEWCAWYGPAWWIYFFPINFCFPIYTFLLSSTLIIIASFAPTTCLCQKTIENLWNKFFS